MARPLRIEFPGATYHVTSRGNRQADIYADDEDRHAFLQLLASALQRGQAKLLAYCLMSNHYHLVLQTTRANLSAVMRQINGGYTQRYNRRHGKVGHLFQGRYQAILVDREAYLLEVCRYVELNPLRARLLKDPSGWTWSSLRAHLGMVEAPPWLDSEQVYGLMLGRDVLRSADVRAAQIRYRQLLAAARDVRLWQDALRQQVYLGGAAFVAQMQAQASPQRLTSMQVPSTQRSKPVPLAQWLKQCANRSEAFARAYRESGHTMTAIAAEVGLTIGRVSQLIKQWESSQGQAQAASRHQP